MVIYPLLKKIPEEKIFNKIETFKKKVMKTIYAISIFVLAIFTAHAQTSFQRIYTKNPYNQFHSIQQTSDGGYIIAGEDSSNAILLKLDPNGNTTWNKTFTGNTHRKFFAVQQTLSGGYIATGCIYVGTYTYKIYLVNTDANGDTLWTKCFSGLYIGQAYSVKQTPDGGFILAGQSVSYSTGYEYAYLIKTDVNGNTVWTKTYSKNNHGSCNEIQNTSDGGFIFTGTSAGSGYGIHIVKTNSAGDTLWTRLFCDQSGATGYYGKSVIQTSDGGYMVIGNDDGSGFPFPSGLLVMIKLNSVGDTTWTKKIVFTGGFVINNAVFNSIKQTQDGGYILAGSASVSGSFPFLTDNEAMLIKTDMNGDTLWTKKYGLSNQSQGIAAYINTMQITNDGGYILGGYSNSVAWGGYLLKTDNLGNSTCDNGSAIFNYANPYLKKFSGAIVGSGGADSTVFTIVGSFDTTYINPCLPVPSICMVTIDSLTQKNMVIWEKNIDTTLVDSYNIYRETSYTGVYAKIGNVSNSSLSTFIDYTSVPLQKANRYQISTVDLFGNESYIKSSVHRTIHLAVDLGTPPLVNLSWNAYEGFTANTFKIWRGSTSGMFLLDSVDGNTFAYTDLNPPASDSLYFIEAPNPNGSCNPVAKSYSSTKSNFLNVNNPAGIGIIEFSPNTVFSISPNPATNNITIETKQKSELEITNINGQIIEKMKIKDNKTDIDISDFASGVYIIRAQTDSGITTKKFIKE